MQANLRRFRSIEKHSQPSLSLRQVALPRERQLAVLKRHRSHPEEQDQPVTLHLGIFATFSSGASVTNTRIPLHPGTQTNQDLFRGT